MADFEMLEKWFVYSYRFYPNITQIITQYLYSHVINTDLSDFPYSILIAYGWLPKFAGLVRFEQKASNHERSLRFP